LFSGLFCFEQLYSGFYKTCIEPHLQEPHILLRIIGYKRVPDDRLFLVNGVPSQAVLTEAAVDFFLAAMECRIISSIVSKVEHSTPVEVYWLRRANIGDEQVCVDTLTLSRRPLPLDTEKPLTFETTDVEKRTKKFDSEVVKRGDSPYDNIQSAADYSKPQYGVLMQSSSNISSSHTEGFPAEARLPEPIVPTVSGFRQPLNITGQALRSPLSSVGTTFQRKSPEAPPPVYAAAKNMPSAKLQNISYGHNDEVDALEALLKNVDPHVMENATHRQQIMSQLENYSSSGAGLAKAELPPKLVGRRAHASPADTVRKGWQCPQCTFYNENSTLLCEMCNSEKT